MKEKLPAISLIIAIVAYLVCAAGFLAGDNSISNNGFAKAISIVYGIVWGGGFALIGLITAIIALVTNKKKTLSIVSTILNSIYCVLILLFIFE